MIHTTLTDTQVVRLRRLRLYHWRSAIHARDMELLHERMGGESYARLLHNSVEFHMAFVEALNPIFLEPDDTADNDDQHQRQFGHLPGEPDLGWRGTGTSS